GRRGTRPTRAQEKKNWNPSPVLAVDDVEVISLRHQIGGLDAMVRERSRDGLPGFPLVALVLAVAGTTVWTFLRFVRAAQVDAANPLTLVLVAVLVGLTILMLRGFFMVAPNEAQVLQLFGSYGGTAKTPGLRWANPFLT